MKKYIAAMTVILSLSIQSVQAQTEWTKASIYSDGSIVSMAVKGNTMLAGVSNGYILRSTDNGAHWNSMLVSPYLYGYEIPIMSLAFLGSEIYAGTRGNGLYRSIDDGASWSKVNTPGFLDYINDLAVKDTGLFAIVNGTVYRTLDKGANWTQIVNGLAVQLGRVNTSALYGSNLFIGTAGGGGVFLSTDNGTSWNPVNNGLKRTDGVKNWDILALAVSGSAIFAGTDSGGVFLSTDNGSHWKAVNTGMAARQVSMLAASGTIVFASTGQSLYRTTNNGDSWTEANTGVLNRSVLSLSAGGTGLYAGTTNGMLLWDDNAMKWIPVNTGLTYSGNINVRSFGAVDSTLFAGDDYLGLLQSSDDGKSWTVSNCGLPNTQVLSFAVIDSVVFVRTNSGIFRSADKGKSWNSLNTGITAREIFTIIAVDSILFAGTTQGVYRSKDKGISWSAVNTGLGNGLIYQLAAIGSTLLASNIVDYPLVDGIYRSSDYGANWQLVNQGVTGFSLFTAYDFAVSQGVIYAATNDLRTYWSADSGMHWTSTTPLPAMVQGLSVFDSVIVAGTRNGIYLSADHGASWRRADLGLSESNVNVVRIFGSHVFAGTTGAGIWRRSIDQITNVETPHSMAPNRFALEQNYPNPFNPSTTFSFSLPVRSFASLKIYDVIGREVATLVSEELPAGTYTRQWNASGCPSGVYFYRLKAGTFNESKRLVMVK